MADWTTQTRTPIVFEAPVTVSVEQDFFLNIGSGFNLLINDTNKLIIQPGQGGTEWTTIPRNPIVV